MTTTATANTDCSRELLRGRRRRSKIAIHKIPIKHAVINRIVLTSIPGIKLAKTYPVPVCGFTIFLQAAFGLKWLVDALLVQL